MIPPRARRAHTRAEFSSVQISKRVHLYRSARGWAVENPDLNHSTNGAATRQPPPFATAVAAALNPENHWDAFTRESP